ncbi:MAG: DUF2079 domain-containing protein [Clostridium sp.]|nr:DUF2079 domain-containing protein [Clostridium sp.]
MRPRLERLASGPGLWIVLGAAAFLWFAFTASMTVLRYRLNYSPAYDFGIFSQMYYYLDKCLQPLTTCERDGLLSHFAVHLSPIFYALLPFYKLVPRPETLLVLQALLVISGLIPLCLLAGAFKCTRLQTLCFGLVYCAYPAFMGGCFYDFHENKFLTVIILWVMYFMETRRFKSMLAGLALLLLVKEDAPVYAACIGLYLFLEKRRYRLGMLVFTASCLYFVAVLWYINRFGDGAMINRFDNYISDKCLGLVSMFKTILVNPAYVLSQIAVKDKLIFFLEMMLPLGFLPLMTSRWQRWALLIPFVLINLMSNYKYQHSIFFQYTYGTGALLFYLAMVNRQSLNRSVAWHRALAPQLLAAGLVCALAITATVTASKSKYVRLYDRHHLKAAQARELLAEIPENAPVRSSTFFVPQLSMRDEIYLLDSAHPARYAVVDLRKGYEKDLEAALARLEDTGFLEVGRVDNYVAVFEAPR